VRVFNVDTRWEVANSIVIPVCAERPLVGRSGDPGLPMRGVWQLPSNFDRNEFKENLGTLSVYADRVCG
jgi:hypothetical protein